MFVLKWSMKYKNLMLKEPACDISFITLCISVMHEYTVAISLCYILQIITNTQIYYFRFIPLFRYTKVPSIWKSYQQKKWILTLPSPSFGPFWEVFKIRYSCDQNCSHDSSTMQDVHWTDTPAIYYNPCRP